MGSERVSDEAARRLYNASVADLPNVHVLAWSELTEQQRERWRAEALANEPATPEFETRMRKGHARVLRSKP